MLKKRIIISLTFQDGVLFRTKKFIPDYRYTKNFVDLWNADEIILIDVSNKENKLNNNFIEVVNFFINNCHLPISVGGGIDSIVMQKKFLI
jgi:imidazole glycerol phosphate synthase subunit HisF